MIIRGGTYGTSKHSGIVIPATDQFVINTDCKATHLIGRVGTIVKLGVDHFVILHIAR